MGLALRWTLRCGDCRRRVAMADVSVVCTLYECVVCEDVSGSVPFSKHVDVSTARRTMSLCLIKTQWVATRS
jgi:hypothetical protein